LTHDVPSPELARPYFTRQAQLGRRVIFAWRPADASPHNPLTTPWPDADELIEGVEFADEAAARRFDLARAVGASGRPRRLSHPYHGGAGALQRVSHRAWTPGTTCTPARHRPAASPGSGVRHRWVGPRVWEGGTFAAHPPASGSPAGPSSGVD
jgi:hypothetical protein